MNHRHVLRATLLLFCLGVITAQAAEPAFVGKLSQLVEPTTSERLQLTEAQLEALDELIANREDEVIEIVLKVQDLPAAERDAKLAPFVAESERLGLAILTDDQRAEFQAIELQQLGLLALNDAAVAKQLKLSPEQQKQVAEVATRWKAELARVEPNRHRLVNAVFEKSMAALLDEQQQAAWVALAGVEPPAALAAERPDDNQPPGDQVAKVPVDGKIRFNFRFAPWKDVLDWFAQSADLSLVLDAPPPGTFNYTDRREYTPAEAIDLLNSVLLTKGYTLVRRERMLMLVNLEDGVPPNLVPQISLTELDDKGKFELVSVLFQLDNLEPVEAEEEIRKLLGPQGNIVVLPKARQILVTETGGKLRTIRSVINAIENPGQEQQSQELTEFKLQHAAPEEALAMIRQLLGMPEDQNATPDGTLRIAVDPLGSRLLATGKYDKIARIRDILKLVDLPDGAEDGPRVVEQPQMEVYPIATADPQSVLAVLQTVMAGLPDVRLAIDPKTGSLVAQARPSQHATIKATIDYMQRDGKQIEVIQLRRVDPQLAVLSINRLFGGGDGANANAPIVDAEPITSQLLIRGTQSQIDQIHTLLEKMGEMPKGELADAEQQGNVRLLPFTGAAARDTLSRMEQLWPTMRKNRIRVVTPSAVIRTMRPSETPRSTPIDPAEAIEKILPPTDMEPTEPAVEPAAETDANVPQEDREAARSRVRITFVAHLQNEADVPAEDNKVPVAPGADIVVSVGPNGIVIASDDLDALDAFEELFRTLMETTPPGAEYTVFYLKYSKADVAAALLKEILSGDTGGGEGGGGSLLGDLAGAALGDSGGGIMGSLLGLGGEGGGLSSISASGAFTVVAEPRLNALVVQANPADLDLIEQLLKVIDQESSPEDVQTIPPPRLIPVFNTSAEEVAQVVQQVYAQQLASSGGARQQPSPQELIRALRGGRGGADRSRQAQEQQLKMTVSVDKRSNSLVVSAPDPLFKDVKSLVEQLDQIGVESAETMEVVTLRRANPEVVQRALASIAGDNVQVSSTPATGGASTRGATTGNNRQGGDSDAQREIQRRIEFFNQLQRLGPQLQQQGGERGGRGRSGAPSGGGPPGGRGRGPGGGR